MVVAIFALLLLSVIGLGMMYSTNMETAINANYRDKQVSLYSGLAGLQEARDRIQCRSARSPSSPTIDADCPPTLNIAPPTALPSLSAGNVIYLINPRSGETVAPWSDSNAYMDTELCQEHILGLSGTPGVPCGPGDLPTVTTWYTTYDDSLSSAGVWKSLSPLDFKWVRLTLKTNNMTPVPVNGNNSIANQVCWDGTNQLVLPNGYGPTCTRFGSVITISVTNGGSGYTTAPVVHLDPPPGGGTQATAHANIVLLSDQEVASVDVTNQGSAYTTAPTVALSGGGGAGATAHVCTSLSECATPFIPPGADIASVNLDSAGTACYSTPPAVIFTGGGGSGAAFTTTLQATTSCIQGWTVSGSCSAHKGETISGIGMSGGGGTSFSGTLSFHSTTGDVTSLSIQNPGTGYTSNPTSMTGYTGCGSLSLTVNLGKRVQTGALTRTSGGGGYTSVPTVSFTTGTGTTATQPTGTATLGTEPANARKVLAVIVDSGGSGYTGAPAVTFASSSGTGAAATASLTAIGPANYKVGSITIDDQGYGYTLDPAVSFTGGGPGSGVTATATLGRGANWGKVYLATVLGQTASGARSMMQMELATPVTGFSPAGALTVAGPNPTIQNLPNSDQFVVNGNDANSCSDSVTEPIHPAIGGYDDPNSDPPTTSVSTITTALPRPDHYIGEGGSPSVKNVYGSLGETMGTPYGLKTFIDAINAVKTNTGNTVSLGSAVNPAINYIAGDANLQGASDGYGILVVTGTLTFGGNFNWHGPVLVVGDGVFDFAGGGNGQITGTLLVAKIWDNHTAQNLLPTLGTPNINWNGGGGNGIQYDHCWVTNMMSKIPYDPPPSTKPLKMLSIRNLPY